MKYWGHTVTILAMLCASLALSEDFKTINGKEYKDVTISRVEPDGILLKTKSGISKVYFRELPKEVQERFLPPPVKISATQRALIQLKRWPSAAEDPATLAKIIAAGAVIIASIVLVFRYIRSRREPTSRFVRTRAQPKSRKRV